MIEDKSEKEIPTKVEIKGIEREKNEEKKWSERVKELLEERRKEIKNERIRFRMKGIRRLHPELSESEIRKKALGEYQKEEQEEKKKEGLITLRWLRDREEKIRERLEEKLKPSTPSKKEQLEEQVKKEIKEIIEIEIIDCNAEKILLDAFSKYGTEKNFENWKKIKKYGMKIVRNEVRVEWAEREKLAKEAEAREELERTFKKTEEEK